MSIRSKFMFAVLVVIATLFSGSARKLLSLASNAVVSDALAGGHDGGASCG